jgi:CRP-like cAMP-binding protein
MADFLDEKKREIEARLKELRPLVDEFHRLEAAAAALDGVGSASGAAAPSRRRRRRGGAQGIGSTWTRSKQALELVRTRPGITIPEIAEAMGIQQNYLYRVLPALQKDGLVRKDGRGWQPREAA